MARRSLVDMGFIKGELNLSAIGKSLGISASTVSRALRNAPSIHPTTRQRVLEMAESMGYVQHECLEECSTGKVKKSRQVLMLSQTGNAAVDGAYLSGLSRAAVALNMSLIAHHFRPNECQKIFDPSYQPLALRNEEIDGVVLLHRWPEQIAQKLAVKFPVVSIVHTYSGIPVDVIGIEEREGMAFLFQHLIAKGHKFIGFFGYCKSMSWAKSRFAAFVECLVQHGMKYIEDNVVSVTLEEALAEEPIEDLPEASLVLQRISLGGVTAWIGASENLGYSLCNAMLKENLKIPQELAITGFHSSTRFRSHKLPLLTSVSSDPEELGAAALRRLATRLECPGESRRSILLPCTFLQGDTTTYE